MDFDNLIKAVRYIFDDPDWVTKIGIMLVVNFAFGLTVWILVGFVFLAAQIGWLIQLIRNMQAGIENPMPGWNDFGDKMQLGAGPLGAGFAYYLIPMIVSCLLFAPAVFAGATSEEAGGILASGAACIVTPLLLVYAVGAGLLYTMGTIEYVSTENIGVYFNVSKLWGMVREHSSAVIEYIVFSIIVSMAMSALGSTGVGALVTGAFTVPITGHLMGQLAIKIKGGGKKKKNPNPEPAF